MDTGFWGRRVSDGIEADPAVPEGIIRYEVTYNKKRVEPFRSFMNFWRDLERRAQRIPEKDNGRDSRRR